MFVFCFFIAYSLQAQFSYSLQVISFRKVGHIKLEANLPQGTRLGLKIDSFSLKYGKYKAKDFWKSEFVNNKILHIVHSTTGEQKQIPLESIKFVVTRVDAEKKTKRGRLFYGFITRLVGALSNNMTKNTEEDRALEKSNAKDIRTFSKQLRYASKIQKYKVVYNKN